MSEVSIATLRTMQDRIAVDVYRANTFEEKARMTAYWWDLEALINAESGTIEE